MRMRECVSIVDKSIILTFCRISSHGVFLNLKRSIWYIIWHLKTIVLVDVLLVLEKMVRRDQKFRSPGPFFFGGTLVLTESHILMTVKCNYIRNISKQDREQEVY